MSDCNVRIYRVDTIDELIRESRLAENGASTLDAGQYRSLIGRLATALEHLRHTAVPNQSKAQFGNRP